MEILPTFSNFTDLSLEKPQIVNYGCWCSKLLHGKNHNRGTNHLDMYDLFCKSWHKARKCLEIMDGPCENLTQETYDQYQIQLDNGQISTDSDFHCAPNIDAESVNQVDVCKYSYCKLDHAFVFQRLIPNFDLIDGNPKSCPVPVEEGEQIAPEPKIKYCQLLDVYPWAEIKEHESSRRKRAVKNRKARAFRNYKLHRKIWS